MDHILENKIKAIIDNSDIVVFMKGNKLLPMCGFSNTVVQIFNQFNIDYNVINVLDDGEMRQGIKEYSQWPTIPQVYIKGKFIGGADILLDLYETSELSEILESSLHT